MCCAGWLTDFDAKLIYLLFNYIILYYIISYHIILYYIIFYIILYFLVCYVCQAVVQKDDQLGHPFRNQHSPSNLENLENNFPP